MKLSYKIIKNNQLAIKKDGMILYPKGNFIVDSNNQLVYEVKESSGWWQGHGMSKRIALKGEWGIDENHDLIFTLNETQNQAGGERLLLKSKIIGAKANYLVFSLGTQGKAGTHRLRLLQLNGKWQADKHNRLQFLIKKIKTSNTLTFQGSWQVRKNILIYTYKKASLITKTKRTHTLRFKGYWQINKPNRLTYILDTKGDSSFIFKAFLETPNLIGKKGAIKYRAGIGLKGSKLFKTETITLYGVWKLHRKTGLSFDIDYGEGRVKKINFGAFVRIDKKNKITFKLRNRDKRNLGLSVEFRKSFLKDNAEWFLKVLAKDKRPSFEWGITVPW